MMAAKDKYQKKDAEREITNLKKILGDKYIYEVDTSAKLIFAANTDAETLTAVKKWLSAQAKSQWHKSSSIIPTSTSRSCSPRRRITASWSRSRRGRHLPPPVAHADRPQPRAG